MNSFFLGQEFSSTRIFSKEDVFNFAKLSGDNNPIHLDDKFAEKSRFGKNIVHGMLVASAISKVVGTEFPGYGSIYMEQNLHFKKPVYIGECVNVNVKITDISKKVLTLETNIYNQNKQCVILGTAKVLYENEDYIY